MADPLNFIIDISHHNGNPDFHQAAAAGIVGVIHKATQGTGFTDNKYLTNRQKALDAGLLWGAYLKAAECGPRDACCHSGLRCRDSERMGFRIRHVPIAERG